MEAPGKDKLGTGLRNEKQRKQHLSSVLREDEWFPRWKEEEGGGVTPRPVPGLVRGMV